MEEIAVVLTVSMLACCASQHSCFEALDSKAREATHTACSSVHIIFQSSSDTSTSLPHLGVAKITDNGHKLQIILYLHLKHDKLTLVLRLHYS